MFVSKIQGVAAIPSWMYVLAAAGGLGFGLLLGLWLRRRRERAGG